MSEETETGTQTFDSSSEIIELGPRQETEMEPTLGETPDVGLTLRWVDERIKQATEPMLRRVEELCVLLASRVEMESSGNSEASGSRRDCEFSSPSRNRYDMVTGVQMSSHRRTRLQRATTMDNFTNYDQEQSEDNNKEPDMTQLMNAITNVPTMIQRNAKKHKLLQSQVRTFKAPSKHLQSTFEAPSKPSASSNMLRKMNLSLIFSNTLRTQQNKHLIRKLWVWHCVFVRQAPSSRTEWPQRCRQTRCHSGVI